MKRSVLRISVLLLVVLGMILTGCIQGKTTKPGKTDSFDPEKSYTVGVGVFDNLRIYGEIASSESFKAAYPNIEVKLTEADWDGHHSRLATVIAAGEATNDVVVIYEGCLSQFLTCVGFTNLSVEPYIVRGDVSKDLLQTQLGIATTSNGELIALPVDIAPALMFYRKDLCDKAGVDMENLPDWDAYIEAGKKLTKDTNGDGEIDQYLLASAAELTFIMLDNGVGCWIDDDGNVLEPKERFTEVLELAKKLSDNHLVAELEEWDDMWCASFNDGRLVTALQGAWFQGDLKGSLSTDQVGNWRVTKLPGGKSVNVGGCFLGIPAVVAAEQKGAAWEVLKYFCTNKEAQLQTFVGIGSFPALSTVYDDPAMDEEVEYFGGQKARKIMADIAKDLETLNSSEYDQLAKGIWQGLVLEVAHGEKTVDEAYEAAKEGISAIRD